MDKNTVRRIQQAVLGTMIAKPDYIGEAVGKLTAADFDNAGGLRSIFEAVSDLHFAGAPVNEITLIHELGEDYKIAIDEVIREAAEDPAYYCEMLKDYSRLAALQSTALELACTEDMDKANEILAKLNRSAIRTKKREPISAADAARNFLERMASTEVPEYLHWGIQQLDEAVMAEPGDFVVVGGYPSAGKTLLSLQFANHMAQKYRVGYYSLETGEKKLTDRLISYLSQVPLKAIKRKTFTEAQRAAIATGASRLAALNFDLMSASSMTVEDIRACALSRRQQVIFVDYLQLISSSGRSRYDEVTNISIALHELAQTHGIAVIALAQLTRPEKVKGKPTPPSMSDLRESGQIEQDADIIMLLYPADPNDNRSNRVLKLVKNKDGERIRMELEFHGAVQTLKAIPPGYREEMDRISRERREASRYEREHREETFVEIPENEQTELPF